MKTPQEIEVWYVIPAIRCELAKELVKTKSQKDAARLLGITESAVSQYLKQKRAISHVFNKKIMDELKISAQHLKTKDDSMKAIQHMCRLIKQEKILCSVHKKHEKTGTCTICLSR
jgi:predicted transcriptional regulator